MLDGKIILVDDNEAVLKTLKMILAREFKTVVGVSVPTLLPALLREGDVDIVLLDMNFVTGRQDGSEGLFWLDRIVGRPDPPQVVLITAFGDIELAVSALKRGAADFVVKPWDNEKLVAILQGAFRRRRKVRTEAASMRRISAEEEKGQVVSLLVGSLLKKYAQAYGKQLPVVTSGGLARGSFGFATNNRAGSLVDGLVFAGGGRFPYRKNSFRIPSGDIGGDGEAVYQ
mgnify:CR=1 FL=1